MSSKSSYKRTLFIALGFVISIFFVYITFRKIEFGKVWEEFVKVEYKWMIIGVGIQFLGFLGMTLRSKLLLQPLHNYPVFTVFKSAFVSYTGNNIFPMRAGEVLRIDYLARKGKVAHSSTLAVIFVERLLDLGFLLMLFFLVLPIFFSQNKIPSSKLYFPAIAVGSSLILLVLLSRYPKRMLELARKITRFLPEKIDNFVVAKLELFSNGLNALQSIWRVLLVLLGTAIFWVMNACTLYCTLQAFHLGHLPWYTPILLQTFISFGAALPSAPGFVGAYHYFLKTGLILVGVKGAVLDSLALVSHAFNIIPLTLFGLLLLTPDYLKAEVSLDAARRNDPSTTDSQTDPSHEDNPH